jgi:hypothetical protein
MDIDALVAAVEKIPVLESRIQALETELAESQKPHLAEWSTLRECCEYAGISYHSLRRPENSNRRPKGGMLIRGKTMYQKTAVFAWVEALGK